MRKPVATMMALVLMLGSILPRIHPLSPQTISAHAPSPPIPPAPTPSPAGPDVVGHPLPTSPFPDDLPPEVEEARARQAVEAVLEKYLHYWGPRYRVAPVEVTVEGEWAHGVSQWRSQTRTLKEPIHILGHRLPDGIWQALMPSSDGLYLQWVDVVPESLVPAGEKNELRTQAAEADALRRPQATPAVPPAAIVTPPGQEEPGQSVRLIPGSALPTPMPILSPSTSGILKESKIYIDPLYQYRLELPSGWHVHPTPADALFGVATLYNYDPDKVEQSHEFPNDALRIQIGVGPLIRGQSFDEWALQRITDETNSEYAVSVDLTASEPQPIHVGRYSGVAFILQGHAGPPVLEIDLSTESQVMSIGLLPADSAGLPDALAILATLDMGTEHTQPIVCQACRGIEVTPGGSEALSLNVVSELLSSLNSPEDFTCPIGTFPGDEAPNSPIELWMPFQDGETWTVGGYGSFYGNWYHCNYYNDYYATDWNRSNDDGAAVLPVANGSISGYDDPPCPTTGYGCYVRVDHSSGVRTLYAHLSGVYRTFGSVSHWEQIGAVGSSGNSSGPHLHMTFQKNDGGYYSHCYNNGNVCPNGEQGIWPQSPKPSPMNTQNGSQTVEDGHSYTSNNQQPSGDCPQSGGVILYKHANYDCGGEGEGSGYVLRSSTGWQNVPGSFNAQASSLRVPSGWSVRLYEHSDRSGASVCRNSDDTDLGGDSYDGGGNLNDSVSSFEVFDNSDCSSGPQYPVTLYEHPDYNGSWCALTGEGWANVCDGFNDVASSIRLQSGWSARVYEHSDRGGSSRCFTGDDSNFSDDTFENGGSLDNQVSSFESFHSTSCPASCNPNADQVALYADTGYGGSCVTLDIGDYPNPGHLGDLGNDNAESIKVGSNVQATLCQHDDYQGRCETFTGDDSNLGDNHIGANEVSSVRVQSLTQPPSAPTLQSPGNGSAHDEGTAFTLAWNSAANATEYYAEYWGGPAGTLNSGWQSGISWYIGSQWAGYTYSWRVKARNDTGESGWSDTWTFTVKPAAPSNLSAQTASCSQINLYWDDNSGNEEGYKIYRDGSYADQVGANTTSYQDTGLNENTGYSYYVKAFRGSTESDASNTVNVTTPPCVPPQPDLRPYTPSGYPYPVVPSSVAGTHEVNTLIAGQTTYFDWHFINSGDAIASGNFHVELWVGDTRYVRYPYSNYGAGWSGGFDDWAVTISMPGWHTVQLITDPDDTVAESDESNNVWEHQFYWTPSAPYADDMESGSNDWTATGLWHQVDASSPYPESHSGLHSWWYGQDAAGDYDTGAANSGNLTSPPVYIPSTGYYLRFWYRYETETQGPGLDQRWMQISVDDGPFENVLQLSDDPMNWWLQSPAIDLSGYAGHVVQVRFHFDTLDAYHNDYRGWYVDDFDISTAPPPACADSHEPNDTPAEATVIAYGQTFSADICPGGDYDFYTFTGTEGDKVVVDIDAKVNGSLLDSYVFLLDSDGASVLAEHDDEILAEVQDSLLGYQLPHDGTYYIKVKAWNHPSVGDADHFYTIHLLTDDANPSSAQVTSPTTDSWLDPATVTVTVSATDDESGINRVEFLWHDADWENSDWEWLGADQDSRDGWSWGFDASGLADQQGGAFYIWAFDWVGNWTGAAVWNLGIDSTPPTTTVSLSPMYGDAPFRDFHVRWYGSDDLSGVASYDVQYRDGAGGAWTDLAISTTETYTRFVGLDGHTYYFRARARDNAGNESTYAGGDGDAQHTVDICDTVPDTYEADNAAGRANWITTDGVFQTHNIHAEGDQDWVQFYAAADVTYTLATTNTGGHADTYLYLYGTDGSTLIDSNDDYPGMWPSSRLDWQPSASGVYYAKVDHWDPWAYGCTTEYGLYILTNDETPPTGQITLPSGGAVIGDCPLTIQAEAGDEGTGVDFVEFHAWYDSGWHHLGDDDTSPYSWNWDCSSIGDQGVWLTIHVWDRAGNEVMDPGGYVYVTLERPGFYIFLPCVLRGSHVSNE